MLLETLTALSETTLWVGANLSPRALFRRLKGQQLKEAACGEALLFFTQTPRPHPSPRSPCRVTSGCTEGSEDGGWSSKDRVSLQQASCPLPRQAWGTQEGSFPKLRG